ncbi:MAG: hypothetical protein JWO36_6193 [Myxococcales bacterium]|nr:hypothetical protein [Myxococcales bacterium]
MLRRIIKRHRRLPGLGLQVPHAHGYTLPRADLEKLVEPNELPALEAALPDEVVVFCEPRPPLVAGDPAALSRAWRAIFHGRVHQAFSGDRLSTAAIRERIHRIGQIEFDEIRYVLRQEDLLLPPADDATVYVEFVALYLELRAFAPGTLERTFPTIYEMPHIDATIALDLDVAAVLAASRPARAPERPLIDTKLSADAVVEAAEVGIVDPRAKDAAASARGKGNRTRAAMLSVRAGDPDTAHHDLAELMFRLAGVLGGGPAGAWADALLPVARFAARQRALRFTAGARLLADVQSACIVAEHEVKVVDLVTWAMSLGKRPIVRALPATREVRIAKHLHAAAKKIAECGLASADEREALAAALHDMVQRADANVRTVLRPKLEAALDGVELRPHHLPERVAQKKLVDELLDQAVAVGRLSLGNLRDALSHNDLKMPDLRPRQLWRGDQLLRCDRILAISLDGVYRRGEIYLRFLQKVSSIFSGTSVGRVLSLYLLLPVLGSFILLEGLQHVVGPLSKKAFGVHPEIATRPAFAAVAGFLFLLLHAPPFRKVVGIGLRTLGRVLHLILIRIPRAILALAVVQGFRDSLPWRWVLRPGIPAAIAWFVTSGPLQWPLAAGVFAVVLLVGVSRIGRLSSEYVTDWLVRSGRHLTRRIVPGLVRYTLAMFVELIELLDRAIYRVEEWLRFKSGQSVITLVMKGLLGAVWFFIAYLLRAYVNLFIEPVVNPIKHFPTVTVAAKLTLPFSPSMISAISGSLQRVVGPTLAGSFAAFTVFVIPGLAGFLVWELKENWKLYGATRPETLREVSIGHHGETMVGFMKPGFHSGTIPKLFAKLRRATWKADERGVAKHKEGLHHVEEAIWKFVDRELVSLLNEAAPFRITDIAVRHVEIASNRVRIELVCPSLSPAHTTIAFEQQSGWLLAGVPERGFMDRLDERQSTIFEIALAGFYKLSGVDIVREQLESALATADVKAPAYDVSHEGIVVWPTESYLVEIVYDLRSSYLIPMVRGGRFSGIAPTLAGRRAIYRSEPLRWTAWTTIWNQLTTDRVLTPIVIGPSLLPRRIEPRPELSQPTSSNVTPLETPTA